MKSHAHMNHDHNTINMNNQGNGLCNDQNITNTNRQFNNQQTRILSNKQQRDVMGFAKPI